MSCVLPEELLVEILSERMQVSSKEEEGLVRRPGNIKKIWILLWVAPLGILCVGLELYYAVCSGNGGSKEGTLTFYYH